MAEEARKHADFDWEAMDAEAPGDGEEEEEDEEMGTCGRKNVRVCGLVVSAACSLSHPFFAEMDAEEGEGKDEEDEEEVEEKVRFYFLSPSFFLSLSLFPHCPIYGYPLLFPGVSAWREAG